jgi:hypothetical protein
MKISLRDLAFGFLGFAMGIISGFAVQEYAIQRHETIKRLEKEVLKERIERENQVLIKRLEQDFEAFKDSIEQVFIKKKKQYIAERGKPPDGIKQALEMRYSAEENRILAEKRKEIDRKIEDLKMKLDF